jgi:sulfide:quinone oxidoreductase
VCPGLGPGGNAYSITSLEGAVDAAEGWTRLVNDPGPVVVAATQGAACFGAAYEFVFNATYQLRKQKLKVPVTYVSAEPFPGHFGIGGLPGGEKLLGMFFRRQKIEGIFDVAMEEVAPEELRLADGRKLPFKYAMVVPPFVGAAVVNDSGLGNAKGFIEVKDTPTPTPCTSTRSPSRSSTGKASRWTRTARSSSRSSSLATRPHLSPGRTAGRTPSSPTQAR